MLISTPQNAINEDIVSINAENFAATECMFIYTRRSAMSSTEKSITSPEANDKLFTPTRSLATG